MIGSVAVPARGRLEADAREIGGLPERVGGVGEALDAAHVRVLVLDVDGDGGVDVVQGGQPPAPERRVVPAADGDELVAGVERVVVGAVAAGEGDPVRALGTAPQVVEEAVPAQVLLVDPRVLGRGDEDAVAEAADGLDRVDALPEQVGGVHLHAEAVRARGVDEPLEGGGVVDELVRVHLHGQPDPLAAGEGGGPPPVGHGQAPLVVQDVEVDRVPGRDDPGGDGCAGLGAGVAGLDDDGRHAQHRGELDRVVDVALVALPHLGVGVQRVGVAVQGRQAHALAGESAHELVAGVLGDQEGGDVDVVVAEEAAGVELQAGQALLMGDVDDAVEVAVVKAGGEQAELHGAAPWMSWMSLGGQARATRTGRRSEAEARAASTTRMVRAAALKEVSIGSPATTARRSSCIWAMKASP